MHRYECNNIPNAILIRCISLVNNANTDGGWNGRTLEIPNYGLQIGFVNNANRNVHQKVNSILPRAAFSGEIFGC